MYAPQKAPRAFALWLRQIRRSAWTLIALSIAIRIIRPFLHSAGASVP